MCWLSARYEDVQLKVLRWARLWQKLEYQALRCLGVGELMVDMLNSGEPGMGLNVPFRLLSPDRESEGVLARR